MTTSKYFDISFPQYNVYMCVGGGGGAVSLRLLMAILICQNTL